MAANDDEEPLELSQLDLSSQSKVVASDPVLQLARADDLPELDLAVEATPSASNVDELLSGPMIDDLLSD